MTAEFHHGALSDSHEKQTSIQGFTFGEDTEWVQQVGFKLVCARIPGCITDGERNKILLKRLPENEPLEIELSLGVEPQESEE